MEETIKDNSVLIRTKILDALKYLLSSSEYWWQLSVTAILLISIVAMLNFISFANPEYATVQGWTAFSLLIRGLVCLLVVSWTGATLYKIHYGYFGNKYKKLGGEEK